MGQFMIRRMFYALITLFILSLTIFTVVRLTGDPVTLMAEPGAQDADLALVRAEWGLDRPMPLQYAAFLRNILTGELGQSFNYEIPVSDAILPTPAQLARIGTCRDADLLPHWHSGRNHIGNAR
jgi:peptide/nickel transport system permease protein